MTDTDKPIRLVMSLPESSHPLTIRGEHITKHEALLGTARGAMESAYDVFGRVTELAQQFTREKRPQARLAEAALPHVERAVARFGQAIETLRARREATRVAIDKKLEGDGRDAVGGEIRSHIAKSESPVTKLADLVRAGDRRSVAAVLSAPPFLSGLTPEQREQVRALAATSFEPDDHGLLGDLDANLGRLEAANNVFLTLSAKQLKAWRDDTDEVIRKKLGGVS